MNKEIKYNYGEKAVIYIISAVVGIIFTALTMLIAAGITLAADMPESYSSPISGICAGVGALAAGFLASKKIRSGGVINGLICGGILYLLILFFSLFISENGFSFVTLYHSLITVLSAAIGGILGVNAAGKRKII